VVNSDIRICICAYPIRIHIARGECVTVRTTSDPTGRGTDRDHTRRWGNPSITHQCSVIQFRLFSSPGSSSPTHDRPVPARGSWWERARMNIPHHARSTKPTNPTMPASALRPLVRNRMPVSLRGGGGELGN
jgi:hypothetical protein